MTGYQIVIPARYASTRFPGKPLHPLLGRPMILHVVDRARESSAGDVVVATDDERIASVCEAAGVDVHMTDADHPSGTDRIAQVARERDWPAERLIVGLQGDEPATPPLHLDDLARALTAHADANMATLCAPITERAVWLSPDRVKVVRDARGMALYFSRAPIPARRDLNASEAEPAALPEAFLHIGLYAYRCSFLQRYHDFSICTLEQEEKLEQLRVLYHGGRIHVTEVAAQPAFGVDRPDDVAGVEQWLSAHATVGALI